MSKSLHDEIMRIRHGFVAGYSDSQKSAYYLGHRDARHAAAELAIAVDDAQEELTETRALLREIMDAGGTTCFKLDERVQSYFKACDTPKAT